jgi:hypothetical protein
MAAPIIKIKRSSVPGKIPTTASLPVGEFGINTYDGKVYIQQDQGGVGVGSTVIVVNPWSVGLGSDTYNTFFNVGSVGIGTTIPTEALTVVGVVSATSFYGDGSALTGIVTASSFVGNVSIAISTSQPSSPSAGTLWYNSNLGRIFIYYNDGDSVQWVDAAPFNVGSIDTLVPAKTSDTFTATDGQTVFNYSYSPGFIDVFLNGIRLNEIEFTASNGTSITLITPASVNDVLDVVEYTMGTGPQGPEGAGGPLNNVTVSTSSSTHYPLFTLGAGSTLPFITTTSNFFEFNPSSGTLTASAFVGNGSGLTGAGSTVADDTSTNQNFFPIFTSITSGTITASKVSSTKLTFNPFSGNLSATDFNSTSDINLKENIRPIEDPIEKIIQLNGVSFDWKDTHNSSIGVIAQEVEKVFPELVKTEDKKSVNYNGLIGVLIEGMKEQQKQINILMNKIKTLEEG